MSLLMKRWLPVLSVYGFAVIWLWGYVTDDTWIHLRYARHLIDLGELSFNPGVPSYGATSPLWIFGLAGILKLGVAPILSTKILGVLSGLLALLLAYKLITKINIPDSWRPWVMGLVVMDAWFQRWSMSGMETALAGAMLLVLLVPVLSRKRVPWLAWGAAAGLAGLTRPEFSMLALSALPWLIWRERRHHADAVIWRAVVLAVVGWLIVQGPWLAYAWNAFGRLTPETAAAKSYGISLNPMVFGPHLLRNIIQLAAVQGVLWLGAFFVIVRWLTLWRERGKPISGGTRLIALTGIVLSWTVVLVGGLALQQVWVISRYVSPLLVPLLLVLVGWAGLVVPYFSSPRRATERVLITCVMMSFALNASILNLQVRPHAVQFSAGVDQCFYGMGEWLRDNTPEDTVIAAHDIGALGYASERRILDLAGLVSPEILDLGREMGFEAMVASGVWLDVEIPDYVFDRTQGPPRWAGKVLHDVHFEQVGQCQVNGVGLRESDPWTYTLYRLSEMRPPADAEAMVITD
jgi:hypothetical protein